MTISSPITNRHELFWVKWISLEEYTSVILVYTCIQQCMHARTRTHTHTHTRARARKHTKNPQLLYTQKNRLMIILIYYKMWWIHTPVYIIPPSWHIANPAACIQGFHYLYTSFLMDHQRT